MARDSAPAMTLLTLLQAAGVGFVVLHREDDLCEGTLDSDIDIAVDRHPQQVLKLIIDAAEEAGLFLVLHCEYDESAFSTYWIAPSTDGWTQLDLLFDPHGRGEYHVRTGALIAGAIPGVQFPVPRPDHARLYLLSKRASKRDRQALRTFSGTLENDLGSGSDVLSQRGISALRRAQLGRLPRARRLRIALRGLASGRFVRRLRSPAGVVVYALASQDDQANAVKHLSGLVNRVEAASAWTARTHRLRPRITFTPNDTLGYDIAWSGASPDAFTDLIAALSRLQRQRLGTTDAAPVGESGA